MKSFAFLECIRVPGTNTQGKPLDGRECAVGQRDQPQIREHTLWDKDQDQSQANTHVSHKSVRETIESRDRINTHEKTSVAL
jgi:hypothetical protein